MTGSLPSRPILVTGSHRSGNTWVGRMLASHPGIAYLAEPFNERLPPSPVRHFFHYVTQPEAPAFRQYLDGLLTYRDPARYQVRDRWPWQGLRQAARTVRAWKRRFEGARPLLKDPIAFFSAPWLAETYQADVVVLLRHPAGFASSLKRLGSAFDFNDFIDQPELIRAHGLAAFEDEFRSYARQPPPLIDQAILLWQVFATVVMHYRAAHPDWLFLRHEDLAEAPVAEFARLMPRLGLTFSPRLRRIVAAHSSPINPCEAPGGVAHHLKRDSRGAAWTWRQRLHPAEIARIRRGTERLAAQLYPDAAWSANAAETTSLIPIEQAASVPVPALQPPA